MDKRASMKGKAILAGRYQLGDTIGQGSAGKVKVALDTKNGVSVAVKIVSKEGKDENELNALMAEYMIMKKCKHKHVVSVLDIIDEEKYIFFVTELYRSDLFDVLSMSGSFKEDVARHFFRQLIEGVRHLHQLGICHRDIKPENLFIAGVDDILAIKDPLAIERFDLKIGDFGFWTYHSNEAGNIRDLSTCCGSDNYVAPEVFTGKYQGPSADIWSCGVILFILNAGFPPWNQAVEADAYFRLVATGEVSKYWDVMKKHAPHFPLGPQSLCSSIFKVNVDQRATLDDIRGHPWLKSAYTAAKQRAGRRFSLPEQRLAAFQGPKMAFQPTIAEDAEEPETPKGKDKRPQDLDPAAAAAAAAAAADAAAAASKLDPAAAAAAAVAADEAAKNANAAAAAAAAAMIPEGSGSGSDGSDGDKEDGSDSDSDDDAPPFDMLTMVRTETADPDEDRASEGAIQTGLPKLSIDSPAGAAARGANRRRSGSLQAKSSLNDFQRLQMLVGPNAERGAKALNPYTDSDDEPDEREVPTVLEIKRDRRFDSIVGGSDDEGGASPSALAAAAVAATVGADESFAGPASPGKRPGRMSMVAPPSSGLGSINAANVSSTQSADAGGSRPARHSMIGSLANLPSISERHLPVDLSTESAAKQAMNSIETILGAQETFDKIKAAVEEKFGGLFEATKTAKNVSGDVSLIKVKGEFKADGDSCNIVATVSPIGEKASIVTFKKGEGSFFVYKKSFDKLKLSLWEISAV